MIPQQHQKLISYQKQNDIHEVLKKKKLPRILNMVKLFLKIENKIKIFPYKVCYQLTCPTRSTEGNPSG
jgi:hypothetical protein